MSYIIESEAMYMYCKKHINMIRCNSIKESKCSLCGNKFFTFNAPPVDKLCQNCSNKLKLCSYCGAKIEEKK